MAFKESSIVQAFTTNATWEKPMGAKTIQVVVYAGGGGGGSGERGAGANISAGSGGGGGGRSEITLSAEGLPSTVAVPIV